MKKNFNNIKGGGSEEEEGEEVVDKGCPSVNTKFWTAGRRVASHPCRTSSSTSGDELASSQGNQNMKERLMKFPEVFTDELGPEDRLDCKPVLLTVEKEGVKPFHFPVAMEVPANFDKEARRRIASMFTSGIIVC